jgi:hypothetical protein
VHLLTFIYCEVPAEHREISDPPHDRAFLVKHQRERQDAQVLPLNVLSFAYPVKSTIGRRGVDKPSERCSSSPLIPGMQMSSNKHPGVLLSYSLKSPSADSKVRAW